MQDSDHHDARPVENPESPLPPYVICADCGRTANTVTELDRRPCGSPDPNPDP